MRASHARTFAALAVVAASASAALAACRSGAPGEDPKTTPNSPLPDIDRPEEHKDPPSLDPPTSGDAG